VNDFNSFGFVTSETVRVPHPEVAAATEGWECKRLSSPMLQMEKHLI